MAPTSSKPPQDDTLIPETLLRKRKSQEKAREERALATREKRDRSSKKREVVFTRAEKHVKEYRDAEKERIRLSREAKKSKGLSVPTEAKLVFVVRIKGVSKMGATKRKTLRLLRLLQLNSGVFVKLTPASMEMLKLVEPFVAYGYPSQKSVRELIYKRGYGKVADQRVPLTDNEIIEDNLGKYGMICMEDVIHEIYAVGPNFKQASNFLWPFQLSGSTASIGNKRKAKQSGVLSGSGIGSGLDSANSSGKAGNREEQINDLIRQMN